MSAASDDQEPPREHVYDGRKRCASCNSKPEVRRNRRTTRVGDTDECRSARECWRRRDSVVSVHGVCVILELMDSHIMYISFYLPQAVLVLKYILHSYPEQFLYYGYAGVSQNVALMLSAIVLWISQSGSSEYEYHLSI